MPMIPLAIYRLCEEKLTARYMLISRANERLKDARGRAYAVQGMAADPNGGSHGGGHGDALERKSIAVVEAENGLRAALRWDDVIHRLDRRYPPESKEGTIAGYLYGWTSSRPLTQEEVCALLDVDRKTVRKYRDTFVINCALLAAAEGLVKIEDEGTRPEGDV